MTRVAKVGTAALVALAVLIGGAPASFSADDPLQAAATSHLKITHTNEGTFIDARIRWKWNDIYAQPDHYVVQLYRTTGSMELIETRMVDGSESSTVFAVEAGIQHQVGVKAYNSGGEQISPYVGWAWTQLQQPGKPQEGEWVLEYDPDDQKVDARHSGAMPARSWATPTENEGFVAGPISYSFEECLAFGDPEPTLVLHTMRKFEDVEGFLPSAQGIELPITGIPKCFAGEVTDLNVETTNVAYDSDQLASFGVQVNWNWIEGDATVEQFKVHGTTTVEASHELNAGFTVSAGVSETFEVVALDPSNRIIHTTNITYTAPKQPANADLDDWELSYNPVSQEIDVARSATSKLDPAFELQVAYPSNRNICLSPGQRIELDLQVKSTVMLSDGPVVLLSPASTTAQVVAQPGDCPIFVPGFEGLPIEDENTPPPTSQPLPASPPAAAELTPLGAIHRMYLGMFGRLADDTGISFWLEAHQDGMPLSAIAEAFLRSSEGQKLFGIPGRVSTEELLEHLYRLILGREPDIDGWEYWRNEIDSGTTTVGEAVAAFISSPEMLARLNTLS